MKAIVVREWGGPEVLKLEEVPDPKAGVGEVLIRLKAIGINPAETYMRSGAYAHLPDLPCVLGLDGAGVIEWIGEGVSDFEVGQRVYVAGSVGGRMSGCYAELVTRPADEVFPLPDVVSFPSGAAVGVQGELKESPGKGQRIELHATEVEIIGEAAFQMAEQSRMEIPEIHWPEIIGMRHRLIHAYFEINLDILWETVVTDYRRRDACGKNSGGATPVLGGLQPV